MTKATESLTFSSDGEVIHSVDIGGTKKENKKPITDFIEKLATRVPFDTGLIPPGLRFFTQCGDHTQIVLEQPPGINIISWGERERDPNAKGYTLAQPWQINIIDLHQGNLLGARIFYSPSQIRSMDQQLYHNNLPNTNCKGYQGTGVGWVCLYHNENWSGWSLSQRLLRSAERCSGTESYNNANMSSTDGTRFYKENGKPAFVWDPKEWEKKTEEEGVLWALDPDLWIPILVKSRDSQDKHTPGGTPLTVEMALNGKYNAYYQDPFNEANAAGKPSALLRTGNPIPGVFKDVFVGAFNAATKKQNKKTLKKPSKLDTPSDNF